MDTAIQYISILLINHITFINFYMIMIFHHIGKYSYKIHRTQLSQNHPCPFRWRVRQPLHLTQVSVVPSPWRVLFRFSTAHHFRQHHTHRMSSNKWHTCKLWVIYIPSVNMGLQLISCTIIIFDHIWVYSNIICPLLVITDLKINMEYISGNAFTYTQTLKTKKVDSMQQNMVIFLLIWKQNKSTINASDMMFAI